MKLISSEIEIFLEDDQGKNIIFNLDMSDIQTLVMLKSVGFNIVDFENGMVDLYADTTLKDIMNGKINPFNLRRKE